MTPEQKARVSIDALLMQAGWHVCNVADANIHASPDVAIRDFLLNTDFGFADYLFYVNGKACGAREARIDVSNLDHARALWEATRAQAFFSKGDTRFSQ